MTEYLSKAALTAALTGLHEKAYTSPFLGGTILIREITARQRLQANQAAQAESPDAPDNALYQAMLVQMAVVDPESGTPGPDGAIDPRTRRPLFSADEVRNLAESRSIAFSDLVDEITALAALGPQAMFSGSPAPDRPERDARTGDPEPGNETGAPADSGPGDADERGALADQPVEGTGDAVSTDA